MDEITKQKSNHIIDGLIAATSKLILTGNTILAKLLTPRTIIAFLMYGTFAYLAITDKIKSEAVIAVVSVMMTFYFSEKIHKNNTEVMKNGNKEGH